MAKSNRKIKNLLVMPRLQFRLFGYYVVTGLLFFGAVVVFAYQKLLRVQELMNASPEMNFDVQIQVNQLMYEVVQVTLFGFVVYIVLTSVIALIVSHRIAGPIVAITAFIDQLRQGNYDYKRSLRPHDELTDVMDALNDLAPVLKERDKSLD
ncbi:MAG: hypothetical protein KDI19_09195 [Pseudomonadales bacterium]|nr:hypothetical protein [Pseudomonadales bacterium]